MREILDAAANTPLWFYFAALAVLWLGSLSLRDRESRLGVLFIHPAIVLALEIANFIGVASSAAAIPAFVASLAVGGVVGWGLAPNDVAPGRRSGAIYVPGSVAPLLVAVTVVMFRYAIGYTYHNWPGLRGDPALALQFSTIGAVLVGVVWGRIMRIVFVSRRASERVLHSARAL